MAKSARKHTYNNYFYLIAAILIVLSGYVYIGLFTHYTLENYVTDAQSIIQLNYILAGFLVFILVTSVYRMFFRSDYRFGDKITRKLFLVIFFLILIVSAINIRVANYFIDNSVGRLLRPQIEKLFDNSISLVHKSVEFVVADLSLRTDVAIDYIDKNDNDQGNVPSKDTFQKLIELLKLDEILVYSTNGSLLSYQRSPLDALLPDYLLPSDVIVNVTNTGSYSKVLKVKNGYEFVFYKTYGGNKILVLVENSPDFVDIDSEKVLKDHELYRWIASHQKEIQKIYTGIFIVSLLLSLTVAVLLSLFIAQLILQRIEYLIEGINSINKGQYELGDKADASGDEISQLLYAFNEMGHKLHDVREIEHQQQQEIRHSRDYLEQIINSLSVGVVVLDYAGKVRNSNRLIARMLGVTFKDIHEAFLNDVLESYPDLKEFVDLINYDLAQPANIFEHNLTFKTNRSRHVSVKLVKFKHLNENLFMLLVNDVTNLIQAKQNETWAEIAKRLAHEIKNPLTPIVLSAERLDMKLSAKLASEEQVFLHRMTSQIITQVDELKNMVNKFRDFANINKPNLQRFDFINFFREFAMLYESEDYIHLEFNLKPYSNFISGDIGLLRQVFHNLIKNAIESVANQENKLINIKITNTYKFIQVLIADNGSGFSNQILENLFEPYRTTKIGKGSGLGLAIVKKILDEQKASIEIFNANGANIIIKLPVIK